MIKTFEIFNESLNISLFDEYINLFNKRLKYLYLTDYWQEKTNSWKDFLSYFKYELGFIYFLEDNQITTKK